MEQINNCKLCELGINRKPINGSGDTNAEIVFVVDNPNYWENRDGLILTDHAGEVFDKLLKMITLDRKDVYVTSLVKCESTKRLKTKNITACKPYLYKELRTVRPRIIVAMGATIFRTLTGIKEPVGNHLGSAIPTTDGDYILPMYNLQYILKDTRNHSTALKSFVNLYKLYRTYINPAIGNREAELHKSVKKVLNI